MDKPKLICPKCFGDRCFRIVGSDDKLFCMTCKKVNA